MQNHIKLIRNLFKFQTRSLLQHNYYRFASKINFDTKPKICYYKQLNVSSNCKQEEIKKSYLSLAKKYHPDTNSEAAASEKFKEIQSAYQVLSNPEHRKIYDEQNGLDSFWQYGDADSTFKDQQEAYDNFINKKRKNNEDDDKNFDNIDEQVDKYFKNKYFKNPEMNKKCPDGYENPFEMTAKLYRTHQQNVEKKKEEYTEHFPNSPNAYFSKKSDEQKIKDTGLSLSVLKEFKIPLFCLFVLLTTQGIYYGIRESNSQKEQIEQVNIVTEGKGYRTKILPLNVV